MIPKVNLRREVTDYLAITLGLVTYAAGWVYFLLPYQISCGGLTGISAIVYYLHGPQIEVTYFWANTALILVAVRLLGLRFCLKTIYGVLALSAILALLQHVAKGGADTLPQPLGPGQDFMAAILGAGLCGLGLGLVFRQQGSTGGTDIIAAIVNKYRHLSMGRGILACDFIIISSQYFIFHDWKRVIFGFVTMYVISLCIDRTLMHSHQSVQFLIISKKHERIRHHLLHRLDRGATIIRANGAYTGQDLQILMVVTRQRDSVEIFRLVRDTDPEAFITQTKVAGVYGEGFDTIKV